MCFFFLSSFKYNISICSCGPDIGKYNSFILAFLYSYRYRKKIKTEPGKYDAMSSNFHDERYFDFSETVTQGNDEDFTSEVEQGESGYYEPTNYEKCPRKSGDKYICINGNLKTPISTHAHLLNQKRHSLGRIYVHGHGPHHSRPMPIRAHSMQTDQHPCSPLAKESERRHSTDDEWRHSETESSRPSLNKSQDVSVSNSTEQCHKTKSTEHVQLTTTRQERLLQKQKSIHEQDDYTLCSKPAQDFLYIDEVPETTKMLATESNDTPNTEYSDTPRIVRTGLQLNDTCLANIGEFSVDAFKKEKTRAKRPRPVEMTTKSRLKLLHDHASMEEHAV